MRLGVVVNDNLFKQLDTLYNYWFVQFEFPDKTGKPYKTNNGLMKYSSFYKREVPVNWNVQTLAQNDLTTIIKPGVSSFTTKVYFPTSEVNGTTIGDGKKIDFETRENRANMQPSLHSVWFAKMKNSKKHLFLNKEMHTMINNSILSTGFVGLQCDEISFEYISSLISSSYFEVRKNTLAHGATQEAVNNTDLDNIHVLIPEQKVLEKYHVNCRNIYSQISNNIVANKELVKLREWLLPMLMNGQATIVK